jgi:hypothetical protein
VTNSELTNQDIFAYALYRLQGAGKFVDVEDVFVECHNLSPSRFGWRKHNYPNYKVASKAQRDFEGAHPELLLKTPNGLARQLTAEGVAWVRDRAAAFERLEAGETRAPKTRRASFRVVTELLRSPTVRAYLEGNSVELQRVEISELLNCAPDSPPAMWRQRLATIRAAAEDNERPDVLEFLNHISATVPEWFGEEPTE